MLSATSQSAASPTATLILSEEMATVQSAQHQSLRRLLYRQSPCPSFSTGGKDRNRPATVLSWDKPASTRLTYSFPKQFCSRVLPKWRIQSRSKYSGGGTWLEGYPPVPSCCICILVSDHTWCQNVRPYRSRLCRPSTTIHRHMMNDDMAMNRPTVAAATRLTIFMVLKRLCCCSCCCCCGGIAEIPQWSIVAAAAAAPRACWKSLLGWETASLHSRSSTTPVPSSTSNGETIAWLVSGTSRIT